MEKTQQHIEIDQKETLLASGFDLAIIGLDTKSEPFRVVYDIEKMIEILCSREEMTELDAIEYLDYNVFGAYVEKEHQFTFMGEITKEC